MRLGYHARGGFIDDSSDFSPCNGNIMVAPIVDLPTVRETMQELNFSKGMQSFLDKSQRFSILGASNKTIQDEMSPKQAQSPKKSQSYHSLSQKIRPRERLKLKAAMSNMSHSSVLNSINVHDQSPQIHKELKLTLDREFLPGSNMQGRSSELKLVPSTEISTQKPSSVSKASQLFEFNRGNSLKLRPVLASTKLQDSGLTEMSPERHFRAKPINQESFSTKLQPTPGAVNSSQNFSAVAGEPTTPLRKKDSKRFAPRNKVASKIALKPRLEHLMPALGDLEGRVSVIDNSQKDTVSKIDSFGFDVENVPIEETLGNMRRGSSATVSVHRNSLVSVSVRSRNIKKSTFGTFYRSNTNGESTFQFVHEGPIPQFMDSVAFEATSGQPSNTPKYSLFIQTPSDSIANPQISRRIMKLDTIFDVEGELKNADLLKKYIETQIMLRKDHADRNVAHMPANRNFSNRSSKPKLSIYQQQANVSKQDSSSMIDESYLTPSGPRRVPQKHSETHLSRQQPRRLQLYRRRPSQESSLISSGQLPSEPHAGSDHKPACFKNVFQPRLSAGAIALN